MARTSKKNLVVADICLYGNSRIGAGFIVCRLDHGKISGDGECKANRSFTEAMYLGVEALRHLGVEAGLVRIFEPSGERVATVDFNQVPCFGDLKWETAPVYSISAEEIVKHAGKPS